MWKRSWKKVDEKKLKKQRGFPNLWKEGKELEKQSEEQGSLNWERRPATNENRMSLILSYKAGKDYKIKRSISNKLSQTKHLKPLTISWASLETWNKQRKQFTLHRDWTLNVHPSHARFKYCLLNRRENRTHSLATATRAEIEYTLIYKHKKDGTSELNHPRNDV